MTQILHIVGRQGSGRTTFAVALARFHGTSHCILVDEMGTFARFDPALGFFRDGPGELLEVIPSDVSFVFREHTPESFPGANPGEWVMWVEQAQAGEPSALDSAARIARIESLQAAQTSMTQRMESILRAEWDGVGRIEKFLNGGFNAIVRSTT